MNRFNADIDVNLLRNISIYWRFVSYTWICFALTVIGIPIALYFLYGRRTIAKGHHKRLYIFRASFFLITLAGYLAIWGLAINYSVPPPNTVGTEVLVVPIFLLAITSTIYWAMLVGPISKSLKSASIYLQQHPKLFELSAFMNAITSNSLLSLRKFEQVSVPLYLVVVALFLKLICVCIYNLGVLITLIFAALPFGSLRNIASVYEMEEFQVQQHSEFYYELGILYFTQAFSTFFVGLLFVILVFALYRIFLRLYSFVKRIGFNALRSNDERPPILFLRAFSDNKAKIGKANYGILFRLLNNEPSLRNLDNVLAEKLWEFGPVYALQNPKKRLDMDGSLKIKASDTNWQSNVSNLIISSKMICMAWDKTDGIEWEVSEIVQNGAIDKTLFIFNKNLSHIAEFSRWVRMDPNDVDLTHSTASNGAVAFYKYQGNWTRIDISSNDYVAYLYIVQIYMLNIWPQK